MADRIDNGGPAFPKPHDPYPNIQQSLRAGHGGMSLRDYIAIKVLPALIALAASPDFQTRSGKPMNEADFSEQAFAFADAMIAASRLPPKSEVTGG